MGDPRAAKGASDLRLLYGVRAAIVPMAISGRFSSRGKSTGRGQYSLRPAFSTLGGLIWATARPTFKKRREVVEGAPQ